jgi:hypothetical protein
MVVGQDFSSTRLLRIVAISLLQEQIRLRLNLRSGKLSLYILGKPCVVDLGDQQKEIIEPAIDLCKSRK